MVEQDTARSIELVEQAATLGDVQAMRDISFIYANGLGIDANGKKKPITGLKKQKLLRKLVWKQAEYLLLGFLNLSYKCTYLTWMSFVCLLLMHGISLTALTL